MKLIVPHRIADTIDPRLPRDVMVVHIDQEGTPDGDLSDAEAFLRWWTPQAAMERVLAAAPQIRWLHTPSAGVDGLLIPQVLEHNLVMTNSAGAHAVPIAEFVIMFILGHVKRVRELVALTPENTWEIGEDMPLDELPGKTLLILGLGQIGRETANRAAAFGMRVVASRRHPMAVEGIAQVVGEGEWRTLLPEADYVVISAPLTDATRGMVDAAAFDRMKPSAYVINVARGEIIDNDALLAALHSGRIGGAALDALPEEPLPADHPLWRAPGVWITPHISWSSPQTMPRAVALFLENLRRYRAGEPLLNVVDKTAGY